MSQNSTTIPTTGTLTGLALAQDINLALDSVASHFSGPSDPGAIGAYRFWADTTTGLLKLRNAANTAWIVKSSLSIGDAATGANADITSLSALTSINGGQIAGMRNKIINGNFSVNQRAVSGTVTLAAGVYGHDRFKAGAGGCTYTFSTTNNVTTLTISAGTLMQVIEGINLQSGAHKLSWSGTAQGRIDAGAYGATGVVGTAVGGTNQTVEFGTGTLSLVQYEPGSVVTPFEHRPIGTELAQCQRFARTSNRMVGFAYATNAVVCYDTFDQPMRAAPTAALLTTSPYTESPPFITIVTPAGTAAVDLSHMRTNSVDLKIIGYSGLTSGNQAFVEAGVVLFSAEL